MAKPVTREAAAELFVVSTLMAFMVEDGLNEIGRRTGEYQKFLLGQDEHSSDEYDQHVHALLEKACANLPAFLKAKDERKRAKRS